MVEYYPNGKKEKYLQPKVVISRDGNYKFYGKFTQLRKFYDWAIKKFGGDKKIKDTIQELRKNKELQEELKQMGFEIEIKDD